MAIALAMPFSAFAQSSEESTPYRSSELSNAEQYYLELINRARMYPDIEGGILSRIADSSARLEYRYFSVDLETMEREISMYPPLPPLAPNVRLSEMAYDHAMDMLINEFQGHTGSDGSTVQDRAESAGYYDWTTLGENVFSYAETPTHTHASFEVDWGSGSFGMQDHRPHRENIHGADFSEIGIARVLGRNGSVGPELVSQEFGKRESAWAFITGVAFFDLNSNGFYDPGEGIGGALVTVNGVGYHAITTASGGYAVPVSADGRYQVRIEIEGLTPLSTTVNIINGENVKVDYLPEWIPPTVSGPLQIAAGVASPYRVTSSPGSAGTDILICRFNPSPSGEGAETDDSAYSLTTSGDYPIVQSLRTAKGASAFHLAHLSAGADPQILTLDKTLVPGRRSAIHFQSLLALADSAQLAKLQINVNGSEFWQDVWVQEGQRQNPEKSFTDQHVDLSKFAGQWIQFRFVYFIGAGYVIEGADSQFGWFIDDIAFSGMEEMTHIVVQEVNTNEIIDLVIPNADKVRLYARARTEGAPLPPSSPLNVQALANTFEGWTKRTRPARRETPITRIPGMRPEMTPFEKYALEPNNGTLPIAVAFNSGETLTLDYSTDHGRPDVLLVPQVKIRDGDWISSDSIACPEGFQDELIKTSNGSIEKRRAIFHTGSYLSASLRLAIVDPDDED